jgi:hypothetical protein
LPEEQKDETADLPRLIMHFNNRDFGKLHRFIWRLNDLGDHRPEAQHPEKK